MERERVFKPPPQWAEQPLQAPHSDTTQSTSWHSKEPAGQLPLVPRDKQVKSFRCLQGPEVPAAQPVHTAGQASVLQARESEVAPHSAPPLEGGVTMLRERV